MFENPRRGRQARNFKANVPKILELKLSTGQIFSENWRWAPLIKNLKCLFVSFVFPFIRKNIMGHFNYYSPNGPLKCTHWVEELYLTDSTSRTSYRNKKKKGWDKWATLYILISKGLPTRALYIFTPWVLSDLQVAVVIYNAAKPSYLAW